MNSYSTTAQPRFPNTFKFVTPGLLRTKFIRSYQHYPLTVLYFGKEYILSVPDMDYTSLGRYGAYTLWMSH